MKDLIYARARKLLKRPNPDMRSYVDLLQQAADLEHAQALEHLGSWHLEGLRDKQGWIVRKKPRLAVQLLMQAAQKGDEIAMFTLGNCFDEGVGVTKDAAQARKYFLAAYRKGVSLGALNLAALCHEQGDEQGELRWLRRGASAGEADAVVALAERAIRKGWSKAKFSELAKELRKLARRPDDSSAEDAKVILKAARDRDLL